MLHWMTPHGEADAAWQTDKLTDGRTAKLTDTAHIGNNSLHLMHSMQPSNVAVIELGHRQPTSPTISFPVGIFLCVIIRNSSQMTHRSVTVPTEPLTRSSCQCLSQLANCRSRNIQNSRTVLQIANLMANSEPGSPVSCSSFLVTIRLSRLVSEIFACDTLMDGQTDGRTDRQRGPLL